MRFVVHEGCDAGRKRRGWLGEGRGPAAKCRAPAPRQSSVTKRARQLAELGHRRFEKGADLSAARVTSQTIREGGGPQRCPSYVTDDSRRSRTPVPPRARGTA